MRRLKKVVVVVLIVHMVSACVTTSFYKSDKLTAQESDRTVLLLPADVELSELTAGGLTEINAEWAAQAQRHIDTFLKKALNERKAQLVRLASAPDDTNRLSKQVQILKLHGAVGRTILTHQYIPEMKLPTKGEKFEWTLGPETRLLREKYGARYGLFVYVRDSYTSAGRAVAMFLAAALFGVSLQGGTQLGFASLVDLDTGDIVWFNRLFRGHGDLRDEPGAEDTVKTLLANFPT